jgi:tetratricopeptide (TPR) repeat protein
MHNAGMHNVPVPLSSLIGRSRELEGVSETLRRTRLVTLTGPGGVGKTRLATELARRQIGRRRDGIWLVDLTAVGADPDPAAEVARALDVGGSAATAPAESLRHYLSARDVLLVLDNCEHVVDACAQMTASLLGSCDGLRISAAAEELEPGWPPFVTAALLDERRPDYENVRAALEWSVESDPCAGLRLFAAERDLFQSLAQADGRRIAQLLLERCPARDRCRAEVLITAGILAMVTANAQASRALHSEAQRLSAELDERELEAFATFYRGLTNTLHMAVEPARVDLEAARALHRSAHSRPGEGMAIATLGLSLLMTGDPDRARELLKEALTIQTAEGYRFGEGQASLYLGITLEATDPQAATRHYRQSVECLREYRDSNMLPSALVCQAGLIARRGPATALRVAAAASAIRSRGGGDFPGFFRERLATRQAGVRGRRRRRCRADLDRGDSTRCRGGDRAGVRDLPAAPIGSGRPQRS